MPLYLRDITKFCLYGLGDSTYGTINLKSLKPIILRSHLCTETIQGGARIHRTAHNRATRPSQSILYDTHMDPVRMRVVTLDCHSNLREVDQLLINRLSSLFRQQSVDRSCPDHWNGDEGTSAIFYRFSQDGRAPIIGVGRGGIFQFSPTFLPDGMASITYDYGSSG